MLSTVDPAQNGPFLVAVLYRHDQLIAQAVSLLGWSHFEEYELQQNLTHVPSQGHGEGARQLGAQRRRIVRTLEVADVLSRLVVTT